MVRPDIVIHVIELSPPNEKRDTWLAVCSERDFIRSFPKDSGVEARRQSYEHINHVVMEHAIANGYEFQADPVIDQPLTIERTIDG